MAHGVEQSWTPMERERRPSSAPVAVTILDGLAVHDGHRELSIPPGLPTQAVKLVAVRGGRIHHEEMIDTLWPASSAEEGRKGIRNVLARLTRAGASILLRDGPAIRLPSDATIDATGFRRAADRVLLDPHRDGAVPAARAALVRCSGDLLPDDLYCDWTTGPREELRRRRVALLDLLAADARRRRNLLEAVLLMELAVEVDPYDEIRSLEVAGLLVAAGRRGRAAAHIDRARSLLLSLGLEPDPAWEELRHRVRRTTPRPTRGREPADA